jgi:dTDP-glucose 4,6-dehydratase
MQPIFVIGSNSFSGASFVDFLLELGLCVVGISRSKENSSVFLPYKWRDDAGKFKFYNLDLNNSLVEIIELVKAERPKYIINFAAQSMVGESWLNPEDWFMTNTVSTIKFHDELRKLDFLRRYVHISTPEVYGSCDGFVKEDFPFNPSTPYAVSRAAADMSLRSFHTTYQFPVVTTRAANVYGPGQQLYRIIPKTILSILLGKKLELHGGGLSTRSFIHMRDVSNATWKIAQHGNNGMTYHISTNEVISIKDLVAKICTKLNVKFDNHVVIANDRMGKDSAYHLESSKIRSDLNWADKVSLDDGIDECILWIKENLDLLRDKPMHYIHKA